MWLQNPVSTAKAATTETVRGMPVYSSWMENPTKMRKPLRAKNKRRRSPMAFLSAKEAKLYGLIVAGVTLLALLGTLIVMLLTRNPDPAPQPNRGAAESPAGAELLGES